VNTLQPSPDWEVLLQPFQSLFTKPGFRYFRAFVVAFAHLDGRLWVTQVILSQMLARHFTNFYRFLESKAWSPTEVARQVWKHCQPYARQEDNRLFAAIDDTVAQKSGKHFDSLGVHHDPMNKQHPRGLSRGHCFVCLAALAQQGMGHWVALFVSCALYVQKKACQKGRTFATKLTLAADLIQALPIPAQVLVIAVADGAYARQNFVRPVVASGRHVLSRLRSDTPFFDLPPARKKQQNGKFAPGRPPTYGKKYKAALWATTMGTWRTVTLCVYGHPVTLRLKTRVVLQRTLGVKIRLVAVQWDDRPVVFLFCTDITMTAAAIVVAYCARFAIETGFRDAKQSFGFSTYQVRRETRFVRLVHLCLWAQTLLRLSCWHQQPAASYGAWRKPLSYLTLSQQKRVSASHCRVSAGSLETLGTVENAQMQALAA
jgi:hypothetical protein